MQYICAHKSSRPFGAGVPVNPITRLTLAEANLIALKRWLLLLLKLVSSSITITSYGSRPL